MLVARTFTPSKVVTVYTSLMNCKIISCSYHHWSIWLHGSLVLPCRSFSVWIHITHASDICGWDAIFGQRRILIWLCWIVLRLIKSLMVWGLFHTIFFLKSSMLWLPLFSRIGLFQRFYWFFFCSLFMFSIKVKWIIELYFLNLIIHLKLIIY